MRPRTLCIFTLLTVFTFCGTAGAKAGDWWSPGDATPVGDAGPESTPSGFVYCGTPAVHDLFAGQTLDTGSVTIVNDASTLSVTVQASGSNTFDTVHLWAGVDLLDVPANTNGTPIPGQFPHQVDLAGGTAYTFELPLGTPELPAACGTPIFVVLHAEVNTDGVAGGDHETAFGGDTPGTGPRWWYAMSYEVQCCDDTGGGGSFETAYAKCDDEATYVFTTGRRSNPERLESLRLTRNRWGWAIRLCATGSSTCEVWAGAGLNDTNRGVLVGTATLDWDGTNLHVALDLDSGYTMSEVHVHAADAAPSTIAPGQYGYSAAFDPYAVGTDADVPVSDDDGDGCIWIVVHAVVYGSF